MRRISSAGHTECCKLLRDLMLRDKKKTSGLLLRNQFLEPSGCCSSLFSLLWKPGRCTEDRDDDILQEGG